MASQECDDPSRRRAIKILLLAIPAFVACENKLQGVEQGLDFISKLGQGEPLKLPPEPEERTVRLKEILQKTTGYVFGITIGKDGFFPRMAIHAAEEGKEKLLTKDAENPQIAYYGFALSPNGRTLALAFERKERTRESLNVKLVDLVSQEERLLDTVISGSQGEKKLLDLQWSTDGKYLSSAGIGRVWEIRNGKTIHDERRGRKTWVNFLWSPREDRALISSVVLSDTAPLTIVDFESKEKIPLSQFRNNFHIEFFRVYYTAQERLAQWSWDGEKLAIRRFSRDGNHAIHMVDKRGRMLKDFSFNLPVRNLVWSPNGEYLAFFMDKGQDFLDSRMYEPYLVVLNVKTGKQVVVPTVQKAVYSLWREPGELLWGSEETLLIIPPVGSQPTAQGPVFSPIKLILLPVEELLAGRINIRDNQLGSSRVIELGIGDASILSQGLAKPPQGDLTISVIRQQGNDPATGDKDLYRLGFKTGKIEFVRKGVGMMTRVETVEEETTIPEGNIVEVGNNYYLLLNGKRYRITTSLEEFQGKRNFRGKVYKASVDVLRDIPEGVITEEPFILDWAGYLRRNNENGGVKIVYGPGWLTRTANLDEDISLDKTFPEIREHLAEENGFRQEDCLYLPYRRDIRGYRRRDTMQDPWQSIAIFSQSLKEFKESHSLDKLTLILHSLGGVGGLHAAYEHLDAIGNIITIDSPLKGLPPILNWQSGERLLSTFGEEVVSFLLRAWKDKKYQERVKRIVEKARERGIGVYTFASKDDIVIPWQAAFIEGATDTINGQKIDLVFSMGRLWFLPDWGHGEPLANLRLLGYISKIAGQNLAIAT